MTIPLESLPSRTFSLEGMHPYEEVTWERRDVIQKDWRTGEVVFEQRNVEFPSFWSQNASTIVTTKYFRGALGTPKREWSLKQLIDRITHTYKTAGERNGYFSTDEEADLFEQELTWMLLHQVFSFNSPVWFNVGTSGPQQCSACFILSVEDTMESILNWYTEEGLIFKGGSGAGVNLSRLRSSKERLASSGGSASGPVSFMRGADASAGTIKSGGATRRAAKMVILDVDHPDIEEFILSKVNEEEKIRALRNAGYDMEVGGRDMFSVQYQNANNSVRVSDKFMRAVEEDAPFDLTARTTGEVLQTIRAKELFRKMAEAAWKCADPGIQYDDTIQAWHTNPETGRITSSNPCSEYLSLDNSSCNLASINLLRFIDSVEGFDIPRFIRAVEIIITAMDISVCFADFPTAKIGEITRDYRQLGLGYTNLGSILMRMGLPYDSAEGRHMAAAITSLMSAAAYRRSAELAGLVGPYAGYARNKDAHTRVMQQHATAQKRMPLAGTGEANRIQKAAQREWEHCLTLGEINGWRNAQATLIAPTGTISFMMDCDTTGIEPDFSLIKFKKMVSGDSLQVINQSVKPALVAMGYQEETIEAILEHVKDKGDVINAPGLKPEHYAVFDCAVGKRAISPMGHVNMMAAVQPFLSGAISKTVNMPEDASVEDVEEMYFKGWQLGLKSLAIYRDNSKVGQPLSDGRAKEEEHLKPVRRRLPKKRPSQTYSFTVAGAEGYLIAGSYPDNGLGEIFLKLGKQGSTLAGVMDAFSISVSIALQHGVPLEAFVEKFVNMRFEPAGMTDDEDIRIAQSIMDYIFRRLALDYMDPEERETLGIKSVEERIEHQEVLPVVEAVAKDAPLCMTCGVTMRHTGSCYACENCGSTSGCS